MAQKERRQLTYTNKARYLKPPKGITLPVLFLLFIVALFLFPTQSFANPGKTTNCLNCHTATIAGATIYVAVDGAEHNTASNYVLSSYTGAAQDVEIDYYFKDATNSAAGESIGHMVTLPSGWLRDVNGGTVNSPTGTNFGASWSSAWDVATSNGGGAGETWYTVVTDSYSIYWHDYAGSAWDRGNNKGAYDDGVAGNPGDQDGSADTMGADFVIRVPAGLGAGTTHQIILYGIGHDSSNSRGHVVTTLTIEIPSGATTTTTTLAPTTTTTTLAPTTTTTTLAPTTTTTTLAPTTTTTTLAPTTTTTTLAPTTTTTTLAPTTTTTTLAPTTTTTTLAPTTTTTTLAPTTTTTTLAPTTTTTTLAPTTTTTTSTTTTTLPGDPQCRGLTPTKWVGPGETYTTISDAFSAAVLNDVICVKSPNPPDYLAEFPGFTFPTTGITLVGEYLANRPHLTSTVTFSDANGNDPYPSTNDTVLDGFIIDSNSPSMYMKGWCDSTEVTIGNNVQIKNTLFDGGGKPAIKWEGGCPTIGPGNTFRNKARTALRIYTNAGYSSEAAIIQGNEFYGNGIDGGTKTAYAQIHTQTDATAGRYILFKNNIVEDSFYAAGFGIATGSDDNIYLTGNVVQNNKMAGFKLGTWGTKDSQEVPHTGQITISGETNYSFAGTAYTDGSPNIFRYNDRGGIVTSEVSNIDIIKNEIYDNSWGGIHTGWLEPVRADDFVWPGGSTPAQMTIRKNKVYGNGTGTDTAGGGIDVMYASGTIENNLVYENKYAGIRVGDGVLSGMTIRHNTVVDNGGGATPESSSVGGGIVYHDGYAQDGTTPCYYCRPYGTIPLAINVKDNVIAYANRAALPGMGYPNTAAFERDYNLIYSNNPGAWFMSADCGYPDSMDFKCVTGQYGYNSPTPYYKDKGNAYCIASVNPYPCCTGAGEGTCLGDGKLKLTDPHDILDDPLFTDRANDDYTLTGSSPGSGCASDESSSGACDGSDRGAWGGTGTFNIPGQTQNYNVPMDW